ncbi:MAG: sarcosine oxidase subunit alpha, partial [Betaproteobacteria bacterium]|nr:sarcosine oxidase subunit alpha [Betaproteobacteria bacterium]
FTNNDSAYEAVLACADAGIEVVAVIDTRTPLPAAAAAIQARGIAVQPAHVVLAARGSKHVGAASVAPINAGGVRLTGPAHEIECDLLCVSGGWDPAVHLFSQSGGRLEFDEEQHCFVPAHAVQSTRTTGAANGAFMLPDCIAQGTAAGLAAARDAGFNTPREIAPPKRAALALMPLWEVPGDGGKKFVDLHNDVTTADIAVAAREGYVAVEHTKRYTTSGMGVDQGKTGNVLAYAILGGLTERTIPEVGTTTFRPPYTPVTMGALAGRETGERFDPLRKTPLTDWHVAAGAVFEPVGLWRRPLYYPRSGEDMHASVERECRAVRSAAGILDASTLGKIDVQGPDAVTLLNRVYTNAWHNLAVGRGRYGFMLREDGMVFDDGVTTRLGEHHFLVSTTSGGADGVLHWLEEWLQCEWRDLKVYLTPVTAHWATICVTGPRARDVLVKIPCDIDISPSAFPHMSMREGTVAGVPARVFRVSFTGELSFEINVPARYGLALWEALMDAGVPCGITPLGTEALHVLRAEKGYIAVGHETDGTVTPLDLGMDWIVDVKKGDFLGKRSLARSDTARADRKQLVGLLTEDAATVVPQGSQIITAEDAARIANPPLPVLGHVTSCYMSGTLGRSIALALVAGGRSRRGERVAVVARGQPVYATIASPRFYDPKGEHLNA